MAVLEAAALRASAAVQRDGVWVRPETGDFGLIKQVAEEYRALRGAVAGKHVLDVGANIGIFTLWAFRYGAQSVVAYEPDPENAALWRMNCEGPQAILHQAAVAPTTGLTMLYRNRHRNPSMHSLLAKRGRDTVQVRTVAWSEILGDAEVLKVDIEGGEYALDWRLPQQVEWLALEWHELGVSFRLAMARNIEALLRSEGWRAVREPHLERDTHYQGTTHGVYRRG